MKDRFFNKTNTLFFVAVATVWKAYLSATLQLHPDEAYYWLWSRRLDFGYYDHSPLVAYFIRATTLFSQNEFCVRLSGTLGLLLVSYLMWKLAIELFKSEKAAAASVIVFNCLPLVLSGSIIITPDIPAFVFWALCTYFAWRIVSTQKPVYWYLLGASFGLALLSKYTAVLFGPSFMLFLIFTDQRKWLKTPHPYAASAVALAFFLPVIYWNATNEWISFKFQLGHGLAGAKYSFSRLIEYAGGQMMVAGPVIWLAGIYASAALIIKPLRQSSGFNLRAIKNITKENLFLLSITLPIIIFFAYSSLKKSAGPNWPAFAYFTFSMIVGAYFSEGGKIRRGILALGILTSFLISFTAGLHARFSVIPLYKISQDLGRADATQFFHGYRELGEEILRHPEIKFALTASHQLSAEIAYYTKQKVHAHIDTKLTRTSQFNFWKFPEALKGSQGLYIHLDGDGIGPYAEYFISTGHEILRLNIKRKGYPLWNFRMIKGLGYRGEA